MRQLAHFETQAQAQRLAAYLVTQQIAAHAEEATGGYCVWVRDEDRMPQAREILKLFQEKPDDPRYDGVEQLASAVKRAAQAEREARQKNVVEMRSRWGRGPGIQRKAPLTIGLIVISAIATLATQQLYKDPPPTTPLLEKLRFVESPLPLLEQVRSNPTNIAALRQAAEEMARPDNFRDIRRGQVWRLVTSIFVHYGLVHLIFNMWWLYVLAGQIEDRRGWKHCLLLVLATAVFSNVAQAVAMQFQGLWDLSAGMSGVVYGVFGYLWMKVRYDPVSGYNLSRTAVVIMLVWLAACFMREFRQFDNVLPGIIPERIANVAHLAGLVAGMAIGVAPLLFRRK